MSIRNFNLLTFFVLLLMTLLFIAVTFLSKNKYFKLMLVQELQFWYKLIKTMPNYLALVYNKTYSTEIHPRVHPFFRVKKRFSDSL